MVTPVSPDISPIGPGAPQTPEDVKASRMSMLEYRSHLSSAALDSQETLNKIAASAPKIHDNYYLALQQLMSQLQQAAIQQNKYTAQWQAVTNQQVKLNAAIAAYNTTISAAVTQFNSSTAVTGYQQATQAYLLAKAQFVSGSMSEATFYSAGGPQVAFDTASGNYSLAVAAYATSLANAQKAYQAEATAYNKLIAATNVAQINANLAPNVMPAPTPVAPPPSLPLTGGTALPTIPDTYTPYRPPLAGSSYVATTNVGLIQPIPSPPPLITASIVLSGAPPTTSQALTQASDILISRFNEALSLVSFSQNLYIEHITEGDQIGNITLPRAYIDRSPSLFVQGSPTLTGQQPASGTSATMTFLSSGLSNKNLQKILSNTLIRAINQKFQTLSENDLALLDAYASGLIKIAAKEAAKPTADKLPEDIAKGSAPLISAIAGSISFAENISKLTSSKKIDEVVGSLVNGNPNSSKLSEPDKQKLINTLSASFKLGMLNVALSQMALTTGLPGLSTQILANIAGMPSVSSAQKPSEGDRLDEALNDPLIALFLEQALVELIANFQINSPFVGSQPAPPEEGQPEDVPTTSRAQAESIVHNAITSVLGVGEFANKAEFQVALTASFIEHGLKQEVAEKLAKDAAILLIAESHSPALLNTPFQDKHLSSLWSLITPSPPTPPPAPLPVEVPVATSKLVSLADEARSKVLARAAFARAVHDQIFAELKENAVIRNALEGSLGANYETLHEFRSTFVQNLLSEGVSTVDAARFGNLTAQFLALQNPSVVPESLLAKATTRLETHVISEEWGSYLKALVSPRLDSYHADRFRDQSIHTLIGENSIMQQYNEQVRILRDHAQQEALDEFHRAAPTLSRPSLPLYALRQEINEIVRAEITAYMDPARAGMSIADMPTNFKRSIDIPI